MAGLFGTDGIRGVFGKELDLTLAFKVGHSLSLLGKKFVIGRDTRASGQQLSIAASLGIVSNGGQVCDVGIIPTPGISFLTKNLKFDYGIMITASHNPKEYNGIKIFDNTGKKISKEIEKKIEKLCKNRIKNDYIKQGKLFYNSKKSSIYRDFLISSSKVDLSGLNILLDCANGATSKIARSVFKKLNANVTVVNASSSGEKINDGCGAIFANRLKEKSNSFDIVFSFDGDGDRVVPVYKGSVVDGDRILLILTNYLKEKNRLKSSKIVATIMSNLAFEKELKKIGCELLRTDVGDKNVSKVMVKNNLSLGGEQSGHIILSEFLPTGDGLLTALKLCEILKEKPSIFDDVMKICFLPQKLENVILKNKSILRSSEFLEFLEELKSSSDARLVLRESGTEPVVRILVECQKPEDADLIIKTICDKLHHLDTEKICAE